MRPLTDKVSAYINWLEERGLSVLPPFHRKAQTINSKALETQAAQESESPLWLIVTDRLNEVEMTMAHRIAGALNWHSRDYQLLAAELLSENQLKMLENSKVVLALGPGGALHLGRSGVPELRIHELQPWKKVGSYALLIPHPGSMLVQPQLKHRAWQALQELKAALEKEKATGKGGPTYDT